MDEHWHDRKMSKGKPAPETSKIERARPLAYARRQSHSDGSDDDAKAAAAKGDTQAGGATLEAVKPRDPQSGDKPSDKGDTAETKTETKSETKSEDALAKLAQAKVAAADAKRADTTPPIDKPVAERATEKSDATREPKADAPTAPAKETPREARVTEPPPIEPAPPMDEPWPDAAPAPMRPVEPGRARAATVAMPPEIVNAPPEMPLTKPAGSVEDPTYMPGPRDIPGGEPTNPGTVPGHVPRGDSRSLRRGNEFALIYRTQTCVITRFGVAGTRGQWRVVEYPTSASASNSYAKEVSRWVGEGYSDYRD